MITLRKKMYFYYFLFYKIDANGHFSPFHQINHYNDFNTCTYCQISKIFLLWAFVASLVTLRKKNHDLLFYEIDANGYFSPFLQINHHDF